MLPSGVAAFLPCHLKSELPGRLLQVPSFGRHEWLTHQHLQGACVLLLRTLPGSSRRRLLARPVPPQESGPRRGSPELQVRRPQMYRCLLGEGLPCSHKGVSLRLLNPYLHIILLNDGISSIWLACLANALYQEKEAGRARGPGGDCLRIKQFCWCRIWKAMHSVCY